MAAMLVLAYSTTFSMSHFITASPCGYALVLFWSSDLVLSEKYTLNTSQYNATIVQQWQDKKHAISSTSFSVPSCTVSSTCSKTENFTNFQSVTKLSTYKHQPILLCCRTMKLYGEEECRFSLVVLQPLQAIDSVRCCFVIGSYQLLPAFAKNNLKFWQSILNLNALVCLMKEYVSFLCFGIWL